MCKYTHYMLVLPHNKKYLDPPLSDELPMAEGTHVQILNYVKSYIHTNAHMKFLFTSLLYREKAVCKPFCVQPQWYSVTLEKRKFLSSSWKRGHVPYSKAIRCEGPQNNQLPIRSHRPLSKPSVNSSPWTSFPQDRSEHYSEDSHHPY